MPYTKPRIRLTTATTTLWMSKEFETMKKEKMIQMISQERSKLGLSTYAAAEKAGINQSTWYRVETGELDASWDTLFSMAGAVGLSVNISIMH